MPKGEEEFPDVLLSLESAIRGVHKQHPDLQDFQVSSAIESLERTYAGESRGRAPVLPKGAMAMEVYKAVKTASELHLGRESAVDLSSQPLNFDPITTGDLLACLKRLRKSVNYWNKESGSQGYLGYIRQIMP